MLNTDLVGEVISSQAPDFGLGRVPAFDIRDMEHPMRSILPPESKVNIRYKNWYTSGFWGDQGALPQCVGYAWTHFLEDSPITHPDKAKSAIISPSLIYHEAQKIDEWPGEGYDGTSVRAGVKVLQRMGFIESYKWAFTIDDVITALLTKGTVVVGTNWYESMFYPNKDGVIKVEGRAIGGHAYELVGINLDDFGAEFDIKNSWGKGWGKNGKASISKDDLARLLSEYGEACLAIEAKK